MDFLRARGAERTGIGDLEAGSAGLDRLIEAKEAESMQSLRRDERDRSIAQSSLFARSVVAT